MATIKSYTNIEQSKKLAEILSTESADMYYLYWKENDILVNTQPFVEDGYEKRENGPYKYLNCWSLAALLNILSKTAHSIDEDGSVDLCDYKNIEWSLCLTNTNVGLFTANNPVDACYEMILKLHELNLL